MTQPAEGYNAERRRWERAPRAGEGRRERAPPVNWRRGRADAAEARRFRRSAAWGGPSADASSEATLIAASG